MKTSYKLAIFNRRGVSTPIGALTYWRKRLKRGNNPRDPHAGFKTVNLGEVYDGKPASLTCQNVKAAIYDFAEKLKFKGGVGLVYFAGHGVERDGNLYLVPYDAFLKYERDFYEELIPMRSIL